MPEKNQHSRDNWYKMDNVSKVFLATHTARDTRTMRFSCTLNEPVDPQILQEALLRAIKMRPQFQVRIRRGVFWHYLETTDELPKVKEESGRPCPALYGPNQTGVLHYQVSYFKNRINMEMFHALSDGTGANEFLNQIVLCYLKLKHPGKLENITVGSNAAADELGEDSFSQFYSKYNKGVLADLDQKMGRKKAYHIRSSKIPYDQLQFFEIKMKSAEVKAAAKEMKVSLTSLIGARLMFAIYQDMPVLMRKQPITISLPVNLRNFYPSETMRNFFNSVSVTHIFSGDETIESLAAEFDIQMKDLLQPEKIRQQMDSYQKLERVMFFRMVPLAIKQPVVRAFSKKNQKNISAVISNMGIMNPPDEIKEYVEGYSILCSHNELFITVHSYCDDLCFGISTAYQNTGVLKRFLRGFVDYDDKIQIAATEVIL